MENQIPNASNQQFCLRWHNHQSSLLSALPSLLDQSHLTDVTLSAEGRTLRAHRVVLSACSSFFSELFKSVDAPYHPVVVLPGTSFSAVVALLTFMYSGEVNVYEEQISSLLALAETLGIKGLADFNGNVTDMKSSPESESGLKEPEQPSSPMPTACAKNQQSLESFFAKTMQMYQPTFIPNQPLNYTQAAININSEMLARYQQQPQNRFGNSINIHEKNEDTTSNNDGCKKNQLTSELRKISSTACKSPEKRKIEKIVENLRTSSTKSMIEKVQEIERLQNLRHSTISTVLMGPPQGQSPPSPLNLKSFCVPFFGPDSENLMKSNQSLENLMTMDQPLKTDKPPNKVDLSPNNTNPKGIANSKLYATCYICHKQLSNQYNLRVHLETHQNVRYACKVCSHVSRSKDALRKHVSYRHPDAPSPCESERRKRSKANKFHSIGKQIHDFQSMQGPTNQQQQQQQQQQQPHQMIIDQPSTSQQTVYNLQQHPSQTGMQSTNSATIQISHNANPPNNQTNLLVDGEHQKRLEPSEPA